MSSSHRCAPLSSLFLLGRLFISVTRFPSMENAVVSSYPSREDLIWTIVASMCLPGCFIRDFPIHLKGLGGCIDGAMPRISVVMVVCSHLSLRAENHAAVRRCRHWPSLTLSSSSSLSFYYFFFSSFPSFSSFSPCPRRVERGRTVP